MARVRIWVSKIPSVASVMLIEHDDDRQSFFPLKNPLAPGVRVGTSYTGEFRGYSGTYHDLPRGFPTNNQEAAQMLEDPSLPAVMRQLIVDNFAVRNREPELTAGV